MILNCGAGALAREIAGPAITRTPELSDRRLELDIRGLNALALRSLVALFENKDELFCRYATMTRNGLRKEETSKRRTVIAMLGLQRLVQSGEAQPFDLTSMRRILLSRLDWMTGVGDLGLMIWLTAESAPDRLADLLDEFDFGKVSKTFPNFRPASTIGLAWLLAGISHAQLAGAQGIPDLTDVAVEVYHLLLDNQGENGVFSHGGTSGWLRGSFRKRFGSFGDQVHAIYALSKFAKAFHVEEPLTVALNCANSIRALQGEMGEWWHLYDRRTSRVVNRYPVFSCHQDGTAPLALLALGEVTGQSFQAAIDKGTSWIMGHNEIGSDLRNPDRGVIWDSVWQRRKETSYLEVALSLARISRPPTRSFLSMRCEARPDHFGWLLCAFGSKGLPSAGVGAVGVSRGHGLEP